MEDLTSGVPRPAPTIVGAELLLSCESFQPALDFLVKQLKFRVQCIFPADDPQFASLVGYGLQIQLSQNGMRDHSRISLKCENSKVSAEEVVAPNGTTFIFSPAEVPLFLPALKKELIISNFNSQDETLWKVGRAGMRYRDLIPSRLGGRYIASHIHIPVGGPVPDYVHYHKVKFQMIYCYRGWVRVVYEDQGDPFVMNAGDCVLQPPQIRHRVLESSDDLQVIEIGLPAVHHTYADFDLTLPNDTVNRDRVWDGQKFARFQHDVIEWLPFIDGFHGFDEGWEYKDSGIHVATGGLASVRVLRPRESGNIQPSLLRSPQTSQYDFYFVFVVEGSVTAEVSTPSSNMQRVQLWGGSSISVPSTDTVKFRTTDTNTRLLYVYVDHMLTEPGDSHKTNFVI
jgi:quercetin dioxygenase-like cupin family protein